MISKHISKIQASKVRYLKIVEDKIKRGRVDNLRLRSNFDIENNEQNWLSLRLHKVKSKVMLFFHAFSCVLNFQQPN